MWKAKVAYIFALGLGAMSDQRNKGRVWIYCIERISQLLAGFQEIKSVLRDFTALELRLA